MSKSEPPELVALYRPRKSKEKNSSDDDDECYDADEKDKVVMCLEDMFDACMHVHKISGHNGRRLMEPVEHQKNR